MTGKNLIGYFLQPGAFDRVVEGVDAVVHIASPCRFDAVDPEGMLLSIEVSLGMIIRFTRGYWTCREWNIGSPRISH